MAVNEDYFGFTSVTVPPLNGMWSKRKYAVTFAVNAAAPTLLAGTPVYQDDSDLWHVWTAGHRVMGFVHQDPAVLSATEQKIGVIASEGEILYSQILLPSGELQVALDAELRIVRELRLTIQGLSNADGPADDYLELAQTVAPSFIASGNHVYNPTIS
jgi:hypothetical protein